MDIKPAQLVVGTAATGLGLTEQPASGQSSASLADLLLGNAVTVRGLPPELLQPQVIEAVVLRNTLLPATNQNSNPLSPLLTETPATPLPAGTTNAATPAPQMQLPNLPLLQIDTSLPLTTLYRIALQWQGKTFDVIAQQPLPDKVPLQIQIGPRNELILRNTPLAVKTAIASEILRTAPTTTPTTQQTAPINSPPLSPRERVQQILQPFVRENLPRQQPLHEVLPALREVIKSPAFEKLPAPLLRAILNLWQALPTPKQLQQPALLKQALQNSGHFFEAHTAMARAQSAEHPEAVPRVMVTDLKAQLIVLATLLRSRAANPPPPVSTAETPTPNPQPGAAPNPPTSAPIAARSAIPAADAPYTKPLHKADAISPTPHSSEESLDHLLQSLGKTLEAGLSRIHLNQLESVLSRHANADPTQTVPTWVLEVPVQTARGRDQFNLRIEQHARKQDQKRYKQWMVQLGFDLHDHGKLSATLSIIERSVAATLWAERENTHRTVQREMQSLRDGLESVGVKVTEMQCRLGVPPERNTLLTQRLVDIHQ